MKRSNDVFNLQNYKKPISDDFNSLVEQLMAKKTSEDRSAINDIIIDLLLLLSTSSNSTLTQHIQQLPFNNTNVDYVYSQLQSRQLPPLSNDDSSSKRKRSKRPAIKNAPFIRTTL
ncbi:unnamed protein product [Rhizophagus irregularis]|uniref:Uncharacterized protein n=1 Tax=Rhizophagus irregularis TaxID=588596 RepID=A0A916E5Z3_9GLOM|nr:unnamed protein product [Rhizophagus irregularis]